MLEPTAPLRRAGREVSPLRTNSMELTKKLARLLRPLVRVFGTLFSVTGRAEKLNIVCIIRTAALQRHNVIHMIASVFKWAVTCRTVSFLNTAQAADVLGGPSFGFSKSAPVGIGLDHFGVFSPPSAIVFPSLRSHFYTMCASMLKRCGSIRSGSRLRSFGLDVLISAKSGQLPDSFAVGLFPGIALFVNLVAIGDVVFLVPLFVGLAFPLLFGKFGGSGGAACDSLGAQLLKLFGMRLPVSSAYRPPFIGVCDSPSPVSLTGPLALFFWSHKTMISNEFKLQEAS